MVVVLQESGSTPVIMDNWKNSVNTADSSLAANWRGGGLERPSEPEDPFSLRA